MHTGPVHREGVKHVESPDTGHRALFCVRCRGLFFYQLPDARHRTRSRYCSRVLCVHFSRFSVQAYSTPAPATDSTPDTLVQHPMPLRPASGECFSSEKHFRDFSKFSTGAIENTHLIFSKAPNLASQAWREGERNPNPSLP